MSPARRLEITAVIRPSRISAGGDAAILLAMTQPGPDELITPHPLLSTEALTLHVRLPSGDERIVRSPPGRLSTPRRTAKVALLPGVTQKFGVAVAGFLPAITAGTYCIVVEYEWAPGRVWRSEALTLVVG